MKTVKNKIKKKTPAKKFERKTMMEVAHDMARGLHDANIINTMTMREFDVLCLPPVKELTPQQIKRIRLQGKVSQPVFAECLNASPSTVKQWETGQKHPTGIALKLLNLVAEKGLEILL